MPEQNKPFVVTDRRKFTIDGTPRPDAERDPQSSNEPHEPAPSTPPPSQPQPAAELPSSHLRPEPVAAHAFEPAPEPAFDAEPEADGPPPHSQAEMDQANAAYQQTSERLDTAVRASNPGQDHPPAMSFDAIVQSVFMTSLMQLGATGPEGQQPRIDLMGARQSIDMLGILAEKTRGNLTDKETQLLDNALFELRMGFLEVTQALARSASSRGPAGTPGAPGSPGGGRPSIVR